VRDWRRSRRVERWRRSRKMLGEASLRHLCCSLVIFVFFKEAIRNLQRAAIFNDDTAIIFATTVMMSGRAM
jgi:hypothetical protein